MAWINCETISVESFYEDLVSPCCRVGNIQRYSRFTVCCRGDVPIQFSRVVKLRS